MGANSAIAEQENLIPTEQELSKFTDKQKLFILYYLANGSNATQAAISAGYSEKTAYSIGQRLLKNVEIRGIIDKYLLVEAEDSIKRARLSADNIIRLNEELATSDITDVLNFNESGITALKSSKDLSPEIARCIKSVSFSENSQGPQFKIKLHSKSSPIANLMKNHGLDKTIHEHTGNIIFERVMFNAEKEGDV